MLCMLYKRAVRMITLSPYRAHTSVLFKQLKILKFHEIHIFQVRQFIYKYQENTLPPIFSCMFCANEEICHHTTRSSHKLHLASFSTDLGKRSIRYNDVILWNKICDSYGSCLSFPIFKRRV